MDLKTYLKERGVSARDMAGRLDVHPSMVSQWINGVRSLSVERCVEIERMTDGAVTCEELRPDLAEEITYLRSTETGAAE